MGHKILLVEDDPCFGSVLKSYLELSDYDVIHCTNGVDGFEAFRKEKFDLCLLDVMMPEMDGFTLGKKIRELDVTVPFVYITAKSMKDDMKLGYEIGADDYIVKPFDPKELLARVKAVSRRYTVDNQSKDIIKYEDLTIDIGAYEVIYKGNIVRLAPKELELFHFMASNPNKVFTREQLMFEVWGYDYPGDSRTVDVHVKRLREKIKGGKEWELQTVWGVGYKFEVR